MDHLSHTLLTHEHNNWLLTTAFKPVCAEPISIILTDLCILRWWQLCTDDCLAPAALQEIDINVLPAEPSAVHRRQPVGFSKPCRLVKGMLRNLYSLE